MSLPNYWVVAALYVFIVVLIFGTGLIFKRADGSSWDKYWKKSLRNLGFATLGFAIPQIIVLIVHFCL
jgi:hypothetical protein